MIEPLAFIEKTLIDPETDEPFALLEAERVFLKRASERREDGRLRYPEQLFSGPKKSGKTCFGAMALLYATLAGGRFAEGYACANDWEQAASRVFAAACQIVRASPLVLEEVSSITANKITFKNGAFIQALASDYAGAAGSNPSISVFDELWGYTSERSRRMFDELVVPPTRPLGCRLVTTYAGFTGESVLLEGLYKRGMKGRQIAPDLWDSGDGLLLYWTHGFVAPWQTEEWREQMRASLRPNQYLRMIENRWVSGEESFVPMEAWDACCDPDLHPILADPELPIWIGLDASTKRDHTAIVAVTWDADEKRIRLVWHRVFKPTKDDPVDFERMVERTLLEARERFSVRGVWFDPFQMQATAQRMERRGLPMVELPQTVGNLTEAGQNLYEIVKGRGLVVYPDDDFRLAVQRSVAVETPRGWRIAKGTASHKIDLVVALAMACFGAVREGPSVPIEPGMLQVIGDSTVSGQVLDLAARGYAPDEMRLEIVSPTPPWRFDDDDLPMAGPFVV